MTPLLDKVDENLRDRLARTAVDDPDRKRLKAMRTALLYGASLRTLHRVSREKRSDP